MLDALTQAARDMGHQLRWAYRIVADRCRGFVRLGGGSLSHFVRITEAMDTTSVAPTDFPHLSLRDGEAKETGDEIMIRLDLSGVQKDDCRVMIDGNMLYVSGEKYVVRSRRMRTIPVTNQACGSFQRAIVLPRNVLPGQAKASYKNGVMMMHLPKTSSAAARFTSVS